MSVVHNISTLGAPGSPEFPAGQLSVVPHYESGTKPLPYFDIEIADFGRPLTENKPTRGIAFMTRQLVTMSDGSRYDTLEIEPEDKAHDREVEMATPLGTLVTGHNAADGIQTARVSKSTVQLIGFNRSVLNRTSLEQDMQAFNQIRVAQERAKGRGPGDREAMQKGQSRGGMGGYIDLAYAPRFGRVVRLGVQLDPSLPEPTSLEQTNEGLTPKDYAAEVAELIMGLAHRYEGETRWKQAMRLAHMRKTVSLTPCYILAQIHSGQALWTGAGGAYIEHIPDDTIVVSHFFNGNRLNGAASYERKLAHLPYSRVVSEAGRHLLLVNGGVVDESARRVALAQDLLDKDIDPQTIANRLAKPLRVAKA